MIMVIPRISSAIAVTDRGWERLVIVGLLMSVGFSLQILLPNPYMPAGVRYGHFPALFVENFLLEVIAALLFTRVTSKETGTRID